MSLDRPMISIVSPVYDEEAGIEEFHRRLSACLEGLAADLDFEIVYVNDGSADRSLELLREIVADDAHVRVVDSEGSRLQRVLAAQWRTMQSRRRLEACCRRRVKTVTGNIAFPQRKIAMSTRAFSTSRPSTRCS